MRNHIDRGQNNLPERPGNFETDHDEIHPVPSPIVARQQHMHLHTCYIMLNNSNVSKLFRTKYFVLRSCSRAREICIRVDLVL